MDASRTDRQENAHDLHPTRLKDLLAGGEFILAPGVFEMFSARIADRMGFKALYMTGYGVSASHLGAARCGPGDLHRHGGPRADHRRRDRRRR